MSLLPDFRLETYFSRWEFKARYHMTASDAQSIRLTELLAMSAEPEREAWDKLTLGYTETWGMPELRETIASTYQGLSASDILCFAGAEEGLYCVMHALLGKDDHAIVTTPNYQSMETLPVSLCGEVTGVPLHAGNNWALDLDEVKAALQPNTKLIAVNFPNNPTGAIADQATFKALAELCAERNIHLFSDEVYRGLERDVAKQLPQAAEMFEKGISLNVMSKAYGLPGLRIGWIACRDHALLQRMERMKHYLSISNSAPSEILAVIALKARDRLLQRNRDLCTQNLQHLDAFFKEFPQLYQWSAPDGGCVGFAQYTGSGTVDEHCRRLVEDAGILLLSSSLFESGLQPVPMDRFRVGFGRHHITEGLYAWREYLHTSGLA